MIISLNELGRWVDIAGKNPEALADQLTMLGLEVEGLEKVGGKIDGIVVGRIEKIQAHPKSKKLVLCTVEVGQAEPKKIVCGAKNMVEGDYIPVALDGSQPPAIDFQIVTREVAGEKSEGMLCAEEELGLAPKSDGLMILSKALKVGTPIFEALELDDVLLDISLTPNRPDCLSHRGVARECAALFKTPLLNAYAAFESVQNSDSSSSEVISLEVSAAEGCPRYQIAVIENVEVGESPWWLKRRLIQMGQKSINNIVDITNLISCELGQPLHAFDLDKIRGSKIIVRRAKAGEEMEAIDHKTYKLNTSDLVIADAEGPVAIAGVMGGSGSEVDENTKRILLECAYFEPTTVRRTSKRLGIHSESSHRYERGIDLSKIGDNMQNAIQMLMKTQTNASLSKDIQEVAATMPSMKEVTIDTKLVRRILGVEIDNEGIAKLLNSIEISSTVAGDGVVSKVPFFRPDIERPIDLVEEVARLYGYDNFEATLPTISVGEHRVRSDAKHAPTIISQTERDHLNWIRDHFLSVGLTEAISFSFMPKEALELLAFSSDDYRRETVLLSNPMTEEHKCMRTTLAYGLLESCKLNFAQRAEDFGFFEFGRTYHPQHEEHRVSLIVGGKKEAHFTGTRDWDFFDIKALVESLNARFELEGTVWAASAKTGFLHPGVQAVGSIDGVSYVTLGQIHPEVGAQFGTKQSLFFADIDLKFLAKRTRGTKAFETFFKFPSMKRDMAIVLDQKRAYGELESAVVSFTKENSKFGSLFKGIQLFDVYTGEQVAEGHASYAISIEYRADDKTLTDKIVADVDDALMDFLAAKLNAVRR